MPCWPEGRSRAAGRLVRLRLAGRLANELVDGVTRGLCGRHGNEASGVDSDKRHSVVWMLA